jgi:hypothetical protein
LWRDDRLATDLFDRHPLLCGSRCAGFASITSSSPPSEIDCRPLSGGWKCEHTEIETTLEKLGSQSVASDAPDLDSRVRVLAGELLDDVQQRMHGRFIGTDHHSSRRTC